MAYIFVDGMDHYAASDTTTYGKYQGGNNWASTATGLLGVGQCGRLSNGGTGPMRTFAATYTTFVFGFRFCCTTPSTGTSNRIISFIDASNNIVACLGTGTTPGSISWWRGNMSTQVATSAAGIIISSAVNYLEAKVTLATGATGTIQVRLNGADIVPSTGSIQTANTTANMQSVQFTTTGPAGLGTSDFDDFYFFDTTGSQNNDFAGDSRITTVMPNGAGRLTQWTANGAGTDFGCVSETTPDGDTTYVSDSTVGHIDAYTLGSAGSPTGLKCVQLNTAVRKDDAATRTIATGIGNGSTENFDAGTNIGTTYAYLIRGFDTNPLTSAAWAPADLTTLQSAIKTIA